jgi:hypothetical protein
MLQQEDLPVELRSLSALKSAIRVYGLSIHKDLRGRCFVIWESPASEDFVEIPEFGIWSRVRRQNDMLLLLFPQVSLFIDKTTLNLDFGAGSLEGITRTGRFMAVPPAGWGQNCFAAIRLPGEGR